MKIREFGKRSVIKYKLLYEPSSPSVWFKRTGSIDLKHSDWSIICLVQKVPEISVNYAWTAQYGISHISKNQSLICSRFH